MVRKRKPVTDTFHKWLDAYTTYMLVLVTAYPRRSLELLKYQQTISCAATKFKGLSWLTYDEQFCRRAANDLTINWGQVDLELWTVTFSGLAKPHCIVCSSPYHSHSDCPSADPPASNPGPGPCALDLTVQPGVPPVPASSHMSADTAILPATPFSAVRKVTLERTRATSHIRAQALANAARDKVQLQARNKTPPSFISQGRQS